MADDLFTLAEIRAAKEALVAAEVVRAEAREKILRASRPTLAARWADYHAATRDALAAQADLDRLRTSGAVS